MKKLNISFSNLMHLPHSISCLKIKENDKSFIHKCVNDRPEVSLGKRKNIGTFVRNLNNRD